MAPLTMTLGAHGRRRRCGDRGVDLRALRVFTGVVLKGSARPRGGDLNGFRECFTVAKSSSKYAMRQAQTYRQPCRAAPLGDCDAITFRSMQSMPGA